MKYNVLYDTPEGEVLYCLSWTDLQEAERQLTRFKEIYIDENGRGKKFPNGWGFYQVSNPRIVSK